MTGPCDDIRVLDLSRGQAGGIATMVLADFGADVIKVEPPGGDPARQLPASPMWLRGKRSLTLDLQRPEEQDSLHQLVRGADVLVTSDPPQKAVAIRADYDTLAALNPGLVYCSITGWGPEGPYAHYPAHEALVAAKSGRMGAFSAIARRGGPAFSAVQVGTHAAAQSAITGTLAALLARERIGSGQLVETSLLQGMFPYDLNTLLREQLMQRFPDRLQTDLVARGLTPDTMPNLGYHPVVAADGRWIQFANLLEHLFHNQIVALGLEDTLADPRYVGAPNRLDEEAREELRNQILERVRERPAAEWMRIFHENGNVAADIVGSAEEALEHPDLLANDEVVERADPTLGSVRQLGLLARLVETPGRVGRPAPTPGEQSREVLSEPARQPWTGSTPIDDGRPPLDGITVLEFATIIAAPLGVSLLGDLGARVIKVEPTNGGDPQRGMAGTGLGGHMAATKTTASKESICINLKMEEGQSIVRKLVEQADVLIHNYRPGVPERLGIGYEQVRAIRPQIVWVSANGYGPDGPGARRPAAHPIPGAVCGGALLQAGAGWPAGDLGSLDGIREAARWYKNANEANPDPNVSVTLATAALLGLYARRKTGSGQPIFLSMLGANGYANADDFLAYKVKPDRQQLDPQLFGLNALCRLYRARDGWICLSISEDAEWEAFCATTGRGDLRDDVRFGDSNARLEHSEELASVLTELFGTKDSSEWEQQLTKGGVGCVRADEYENAGQFFLHNEQMHANGFAPLATHAVLGEYQRWGPLVAFSKTPGRYGPGVLAGQHTDSILAELGYKNEAVGELHETGVVWVEEPFVL